MASRWFRTKSKEHVWTCDVPDPILGLYDFVAGVFLWLLTGIKWLEIGLLEGRGYTLTALAMKNHDFTRYDEEGRIVFFNSKLQNMVISLPSLHSP